MLRLGYSVNQVVHDYCCQGRVHTITLEDHVAMAGQGRITDRSEEHLGKSDAAIIVLRRLWQRELTAFAEGRPPKRWVRTAELRPSEWQETAKAG